MTNVNPIYSLESTSHRGVKIDPLAEFKPEIILDYDYESIKQISSIAEVVKKYIRAIYAGDRKMADSQLAILFKDKQYLVQAMLEAVIEVINIANLQLVATVFNLVVDEIDIFTTIILTDAMITSARSDSFRNFVDEIEKNPDDKIRELAIEVLEGDLGFDKIIEAYSDYLDEDYYKLGDCDVEYWLYGFFLFQNVAVDKMPKKIDTLPPPTPAQKRRARQLYTYTTR